MRDQDVAALRRGAQIGVAVVQGREQDLLDQVDDARFRIHHARERGVIRHVDTRSHGPELQALRFDEFAIGSGCRNDRVMAAFAQAAAERNVGVHVAVGAECGEDGVHLKLLTGEAQGTGYETAMAVPLCEHAHFRRGARHLPPVAL